MNEQAEQKTVTQNPASGSEEAATWRQDVEVTIRNAGCVVTLNRPKALNALTTDMRAQVARNMVGLRRNPEIYALIICSSSARAFCAGGDVREMSALAQTDQQAARDMLAAEYQLNWNLECFSKPTISLIDGMIMGSGVGLSAYGTHRVAGTGYVFAMPEVAIGFFPDVGVSSLLARMPSEIGTYLGLTGAKIDRADAFYLGVVTHCIAADKFAAITAQLCDADPVDPVLDALHEDPGASHIKELAPVIQRCFAASDVAQIIANLQAVRGDHQQWADETIAAMTAASPLSLKVTLRLIRAAQTMDLRQTLIVDYRLGCRFVAAADFHEGVRAALIDKDGKPQWQPARLEDVTEEMVDAYFMPLGDDDLQLKSRAEMQIVK